MNACIVRPLAGDRAETRRGRLWTRVAGRREVGEAVGSSGDVRHDMGKRPTWMLLLGIGNEGRGTGNDIESRTLMREQYM